MAHNTQHTNDPIPLVSQVADVYSDKNAVLQQGHRWDQMTSQFQNDFNHKPDFIARAPGRVNVIGEHVDHMGFGVLPAAIELDILMAVRVVPASSEGAKTGSISFDLRNTTKRFGKTSFDSPLDDAASVELIHQGDSRWANYFKVAWKGLHPHLPEHVLSAAPASQIQVLVDGTIPPESSLSSSAAMTVCSSIVILESLGARPYISRREMAEVAIESERYVGVASGGMDQSASIFGYPDSVLHIVFHPGLAISRVQMPSPPPSEPECTFLVANTLVVSDKKVNGPVQYNLRVVELLIAARVFARKHGLPLDDSTKTWRKLMDTFFQQKPQASQSAEADKVRQSLGDEAAQIFVMSKLVEESLPHEPVSREEAEELSGYKGDAFKQEFLSQFEVRADKYDLFRRTRHVFAESLRVHQFRALCLSGSTSYSSLGSLMNDSHASLARDYENTCPELESIVTLAREAGSLGSRLTGAGWGGSTVHLVPTGKVADVTEALRKGYYAKRWPELDEAGLKSAILESRPAGGACVMRF